MQKSKPKKPYLDFPLFPHATKRWAKKIKGKLHYFGPWDDPNGALQKYLDQKDDLQAGRVPRGKATTEALTVADLCNTFLDAKRHLLDTTELSPRTFAEYHKTCKDLAKFFGRLRPASDLRPDDFERLRAQFATTLGPVQLGNTIQRVRSVFKFGYDATLLDQPMRFGPHFKRPSRRVIRHARNQRGPRMFEADEIRRILAACDGQMHAMVLLGLNAAFGQTDVSTLRRDAIDLNAGWLSHPRPKTAIQRRIPLWPETVTALEAVMETERTPPKDPANANLVFITIRGNPWTRTKQVPKPKPGAADFAVIDTLGLQFGKLLRALNLKRPALNYYALRHTTETIGGEARDQVALDAIMGHVDGSMAGIYRERISDERLQAVTERVRRWLWPDDASTDNDDVSDSLPSQLTR